MHPKKCNFRKESIWTAIPSVRIYLYDCRYCLTAVPAPGLEKYGYDHTVSTAQFVCEHPEALTQLQQGFIDAGSQILYTATHGANRENLKAYGVEDKTNSLTPPPQR